MSSLSERVKIMQKAKEAVYLEKTNNEYYKMALTELGQVSLKHGAHARNRRISPHSSPRSSATTVAGVPFMGTW